MGELHFRVERLLSLLNTPIHWAGITLEPTEIRFGCDHDVLSIQEYKLLKLLIRHSGEIVPREALYYAIWGKPGQRSRAVDMHVSKLRGKLSTLQNEVPLEERITIVSVRGEGYLLR